VPTVVVHSGHGEPAILDTLDTWPEIGLRPVAVLDESIQDDDNNVSDPAKWASHLADRFGSAYAILSLSTASHESRAQRVMEYAKVFDHVFVPSAMRGAPAFWTSGCAGDGLHGYGVRNAASAPVLKILKRAIDLVGASLALAVVSPLFAIISLQIRKGSSGPIFFRQKRMGPDGQDFEVLKFRSMYEDADERLEEVLDRDPERREEYERYHKLSDDPRVTPIGKFLRRTSLDELPQLLNVLRGEMSLVGPRAYMPSESSKMKGMESVILSARPGVTGLWQVSGRNKLSFTERVDLDVHYVQNWSLALDLYLLVRTIPTVITGEGAL
jgi:Undecaprenyl-phosphate galactose phosphotransferase WbaP